MFIWCVIENYDEGISCGNLFDILFMEWKNLYFKVTHLIPPIRQSFLLLFIFFLLFWNVIDQFACQSASTWSDTCWWWSPRSVCRCAAWRSTGGWRRTSRGRARAITVTAPHSVAPSVAFTGLHWRPRGNRPCCPQTRRRARAHATSAARRATTAPTKAPSSTTCCRCRGSTRTRCCRLVP